MTLEITLSATLDPYGFTPGLRQALEEEFGGGETLVEENRITARVRLVEPLPEAGLEWLIRQQARRFARVAARYETKPFEVRAQIALLDPVVLAYPDEST